MKKKISIAIYIFLIFASVQGNTVDYSGRTAFAYYSTSGYPCTLFKFGLDSSIVISVIGTAQYNYFEEGDWANPEGNWNYYVTGNNINPAIYRVDTTSGDVTNLGAISGLLSGHTVSLMSWDHTTNKFYIISSFIGSAQLYSLNWSTKTLSAIGAPNTTCTNIAFGGFNRSGVLYVVDAVTDYVYRVNKITGMVTQTGPAGYNYLLNTAGAFDRSCWNYYSIPSNGSLSSLFLLDSNLTYINNRGSIPYGNVKALCIAASPITSVIHISSEIPSSYKLYQNYPNPFNPSTNIKFEIREPGFTTLKVYNSIGKEVASLVNEYLEAGEYETMFDGAHLTSGIYFYKLISGEFTKTNKMILIK